MARKAMLSVDDLIDHSKNKGIRFDIISEEDAKSYLNENNNYFKLTSYRKNYQKYDGGQNAGKYIDLDFAYLIELARIDVEIRYIILKMCLDIEHFLKVKLIKEVENNMRAGTGEDGYKIIIDYLTDCDTSNFMERAGNVSSRASSIVKMNSQSERNPYCKKLMEKYKDEMPIWAFVEMISFGELEKIVRFYSNKTGWAVVDEKSLDRVRQIRNAAAHNNCIINDLIADKESSNAPKFITQFVSKAGIGENMRNKKLSNKRISQIVHLLYVYDKVVTSENTRKNRLSELKDLLQNRIVQHKEYFSKNSILVSNYEFFEKLILNNPDFC